MDQTSAAPNVQSPASPGVTGVPVGTARPLASSPPRPLAPWFARAPIRWRLTVWYAGLLAGALLVFGVAIYGGLRWRLNDLLDDQLRNQAGLSLATIQAQGGTLTIPPGDPLGELDDDDAFLRLLNDRAVTVAVAGARVADLPLDTAAVRAAFDGQTRLSTVLIGNDDYFRVITVPVRDAAQEGRVVGVLQVGLEREDIDEELSFVLSMLLILSPLVLAVATIGGYVLARRALAPVADITALADRVSASDLNARLNLDLPDDELGGLARTFDRMLGRIEDAFTRQRRFTGDAAHELRTPLSLMRSQVDLALARPRTVVEYQGALRDLDVDLQRLTGLVGTLLALARSDEGSVALDPTPFDLRDLCDLVVEQFVAYAATADVTLAGDTAPTPVVADEDRLLQALVNLLDNALTHTPAGGTITIGCRPHAAGALIWVEDSGVGIAPEHHERIFDRFYRVESGRPRAGATTDGGAGLGLSITRAIVEAHGGTITLTSDVGRGTRVEMTLPTE